MRKRTPERNAENKPSYPSYTYSYTAFSIAHPIDQEPLATPTQHHTPFSDSAENIPLSAFSGAASAMQTVARYLVDKRGLSYTDAARLLGRSPKSIWASYHQAAPLEIQDSDQEPTIDIPISIFNGELPPLEALVRHLKTLGLRNVDIAKALGLDPRTVWTTAKRSEARS